MLLINYQAKCWTKDHFGLMRLSRRRPGSGDPLSRPKMLVVQ
jgi:hypothetical protein